MKKTIAEDKIRKTIIDDEVITPVVEVVEPTKSSNNLTGLILLLFFALAVYYISKMHTNE